MRIRDAVLLAACAAGAGCAGLTDRPQPPAGWLRPIEAEAVVPQGFGAWCALRFDTRPFRIQGELIAVTTDSVFVLGNEGLLVRPARDLMQAACAVGRHSTGSHEVDWIDAAQRRELARFARFPGGIPAGIDPRALRPKM